MDEINGWNRGDEQDEKKLVNSTDVKPVNTNLLSPR